MSDDHFGSSPWDDVISPSQGSKFTGLDEHIVNELSTTFAASDINASDHDGENEDDAAARLAEEEASENNVKSSEISEDKVDTVEPETKDTSELLSSLTQGSDKPAFITEVSSPPKGESLFKQSDLISPHTKDEEEQDEDKHVSISTNVTSSPTKLRRQNIYKTPRLRRNPLKSKSEEASQVEAPNDADPLGPLGAKVEAELPDDDTESAAERLLRQSETPLFQINRTPLSPLKPKIYNKAGNESSQNESAKSQLGEEQLLEQAKLEQKAKEKAEPAIKLDITVGDPVKVGDLTSAHIVYSVRTQTDSELFNAPTVVVSRRYRDFRWLYRQLQATHPGRIIPPPPDKQAVGRFKEDFIEGRRFALERMLVKISENVHLQKDPDFIMFLQSERFTSEAREREKAAATSSIFTDPDTDGSLSNNSGGFLSSIGGAFSFTPKVTETDAYFRDKRAYIENLDQQFKVFLRNLETIVLQRHDLATVTEEFANIITTLADLEISKSATDLFQDFATTQLKIKELLDRLSLQDMLTLGSTLDEYQRVIASIKTTFQQRERVLLQIATSQHELKKKTSALDKLIKYGSTQTDKLDALRAEVASLEQKHKATEEKFELISATMRDELATFEVEKIYDFRNSIEIYLESTIESQKEAVELWETFYSQNLSTVA